MANVVPYSSSDLDQLPSKDSPGSLTTMALSASLSYPESSCPFMCAYRPDSRVPIISMIIP
jgi:hypothetical protein